MKSRACYFGGGCLLFAVLCRALSLRLWPRRRVYGGYSLWEGQLILLTLLARAAAALLALALKAAPPRRGASPLLSGFSALAAALPYIFVSYPVAVPLSMLISVAAGAWRALANARGAGEA